MVLSVQDKSSCMHELIGSVSQRQGGLRATANRNVFFIIFRTFLFISGLFSFNNKVNQCCRFKVPVVHLFHPPSSISIECFHPRLFSFETSVSFRIVPSGLEASKTMLPRYPTVSLMRYARSRMLISFPVPIFIWQFRTSLPEPFRSANQPSPL